MDLPSFSEAVRWMREKGILPTTLSSVELRDLAVRVREQSFFSARNFIEQALETQRQAVVSLLEPKQVQREDRVTVDNPQGFVTEGLNPTYARVKIKEMYQEIGYQAAPEDQGTIKDLSSDRRIDLVVKTNEDLGRGYGFKRKSQDPELLDLFPGWELVRYEERKEKRPWITRWMLAGNATGWGLGDGWTVMGGRMVALVNHPIWTQLGSSRIFDDALDVSYPPFAFNSGMWVERVSREECLALGILKAGDSVGGEIVEFVKGE